MNSSIIKSNGFINMFHTISEKILALKSGLKEVYPGELVTAHPDKVMSHDNAGLVIRHFRTIGAEKVFDPKKIIIPLDHRVPAESERTAAAHKSIREFVIEQGIENFYDIKEGICHQVMVENGHVKPGELILGTDSHTTSYGCLAAASSGIGATEMAAVWATGELWLRVPETIRIEINGRFIHGVTSKDLALFLLGQLTARGADYKAVEYYGGVIDNIPVSGRFTLCNMSMEMGAKFGIVPYDNETAKYIKGRVKNDYTVFSADPDAVYSKRYKFDISEMTPQIAKPHRVDNVVPLSEAAGIKIDQVVIGSCTNGRIDDLQIAADILKDKKVNSRVRLLVIPGSRSIYLQAIKQGILEILLNAEAVILNPGCGPCLGAHQGILAPGEKCLATTNRNFKGRMGSTDAEVYLSSPIVAAKAAIIGEIPEKVDPA
ncbi:MAG: 3-isopropylmalate dehydratase large subunit [Candidatus Hatepunaea meridiana]|nr:3-isopropylmalate dehydratase large subunit [Candidatus Hatepunaea meridiana]